MWKTHSTFNEAYSFVKKIRPEIDPNNGFRRQLKTFENLLKEQKKADAGVRMPLYLDIPLADIALNPQLTHTAGYENL